MVCNTILLSLTVPAWCKKTEILKIQKILKNPKKIVETWTWSQKKRLDERNPLIPNMYVFGENKGVKKSKNQFFEIFKKF